jgi:hypothetical protein
MSTADLKLNRLPPSDPADSERIEEMRFRRRLLYGLHVDDVRQALRAAFGLERASAMGWVDTAANPYVQLWHQLAALYQYAPAVEGPHADVATAVTASGHWSRMIRTQRDVLGLRELFVLLHWEPTAGKLQCRPIFPDLFSMPRAKRHDPTELAYIAIALEAAGGWEFWEYQLEDAEGNEAPKFTRRAGSAQGDVIEELAGEAYPHRDLSGPIIPGVMYHAADTGTLLDWHSGSDIARGAVRMMVFWTSFGHLLNDASWQQRVLIDGEVSGVETQERDGRAVVIADPATVMQVRSEEGKQASATAFPVPADPEAVFRTISMYGRQLGTLAGVRSPEATRSESDIRSGYSLAVSREAIAEAQIEYAPVFARADRQLLHIAATLMGRSSAGPEDWQVIYQALAPTPAELKARLDVVTPAIAAGLMTRLQAVQVLYPHLTVERAKALLDTIDREAKPT